ncbi:MAG: putative DNA-binding domain-containing protein [Bermanella sp.]
MSDQGFKEVQQAFTSSIRAPEPHSTLGVEDRRLNVYRELFYNNIESFISGTFPVLKSYLSDTQWHGLVRTFFLKHESETPYFLEISEEFLHFLQSDHDDAKQLPDFAYSLAHWEWLELFADAYVETQGPLHPCVDLENEILTTSQCAWLQAYEYPVHQIMPGEPVSPAPTFLLIYRDAQLSVGFIELNPLSYLLFEALQNNTHQHIEQIVEGMATAHNMPLNQLLPAALETISSWVDLQLIKSKV